MKIILGSSSQTRKAILKSKGYIFEAASPDIDEKAIRADDYYQLPLLIARAKMEKLLSKISDEALIITTDTIVVCDGNVYEKPKDAEEAKMFLKKYSDGYPAETVAAVVVANTKNGKRAEGTDRAKIFFNPIPDNAIEEYIKDGDPFSKAGGFAIQSSVLQPYLNKIEGTEDSIMGMPLALLEKLIAQVS